MQALYSWLWRLVPGNPQVVRIVQGASRRNPHALVRIGYLLVLMGIVLIGLIGGGGLSGSGDLSELAQAGAQIFRVVAMGQIVLVCLIAPIFMAGAIASEQSGKTYNILLTTPLSNLQIVLGSLIGRLFFILALLFSGLPLFAVMLIFGGVPVQSIFVAFAVAALTALFVGAVAVLLSVMRAGGRKAVFVFVISIVAYLLVVGSLDMLLLRNLGSSSGQTTVVTAAHPLLVLEASINRSKYAPPGPEQLAQYAWPIRLYLGQPFAAFATLTAGSSLLIVLFCSLWVRRIGTGDSKLAVWVKGKLRLTGSARRRNARSLGTGNPIAWREANTRGKLAGGILARYGFAVLGLIALGILMFYYHFDGSWSPALGPDGKPVSTVSVKQTANPGNAPYWFRQALTALLIAEVTIITLVALYMAAGSVSKEREDGTLDIMLTTPITPRYYIWGKLRGLVRFLSVMIALPVLSLALVGGYTLIGQALGWPQATVLQQTITYGTGAPAGTSTPTPLVYPETAIHLLIMLLPFIAVCVAVGMYASLRAKGVLGAIIPSIAIIGGGALVFGFCGLAASNNIPLIGPVLNAFSPATNLFMLIDPHQWVEGFGESTAIGRVSLFIAAIASAAGYATIVWAFIATMVRGFDHTVRRLSGTK